MVRYSLRMLLIVVALLGGPLARLGYLTQTARAHRQTVETLIPTLCVSDRGTPDEIRSQISFMASDASRLSSRVIGHPHVVGIGSTEVIDLESDAGRGHVIQNEVTLAEWKQAIAHEIVARRFDQTFFRPLQSIAGNVASIVDWPAYHFSNGSSANTLRTPPLHSALNDLKNSSPSSKRRRMRILRLSRS